MKCSGRSDPPTKSIGRTGVHKVNGLAPVTYCISLTSAASSRVLKDYTDKSVVGNPPARPIRHRPTLGTVEIHAISMAGALYGPGEDKSVWSSNTREENIPYNRNIPSIFSRRM